MRHKVRKKDGNHSIKIKKDIKCCWRIWYGAKGKEKFDFIRFESPTADDYIFYRVKVQQQNNEGGEK